MQAKKKNFWLTGGKRLALLLTAGLSGTALAATPNPGACIDDGNIWYSQYGSASTSYIATTNMTTNAHSGNGTSTGQLIGDIAWGADGNLYAIKNASSSTTSSVLYSVNPSTHALTTASTLTYSPSTQDFNSLGGLPDGRLLTAVGNGQVTAAISSAIYFIDPALSSQTVTSNVWASGLKAGGSDVFATGDLVYSNGKVYGLFKNGGSGTTYILTFIVDSSYNYVSYTATPVIYTSGSNVSGATPNVWGIAMFHGTIYISYQPTVGTDAKIYSIDPGTGKMAATSFTYSPASPYGLSARPEPFGGYCPPSMTVQKTTVGGTGTFGFTGDNGFTPNTSTTPPKPSGGSAISITTTAPNTPVAATKKYLWDSGISATLSESVLPSGWTFSGVTCTNGTTAITPTVSGTNFTISATDIQNNAGGNITCTVTNTVQAVSVQLQKTWVNAAVNDAATVTVSGSANGTGTLSSVANTANETDTTTVTVKPGETLTLAETLAAANVGGYTASAFTCTGGGTQSGTNGTTLTTSASDVGKTIVCTITNTRTSNTLQLAKSWTNGKTGDVASIAATTNTGISSNIAAFTATAPTAANSGTAVTVYSGDTFTLPAETMTTGSLANYTTIVGCTNSTSAPSGTNGQASNTLVINKADTGKTIVCTYNNARKSATLAVNKVWAANSKAGDVVTVNTTGLTNNATAPASTATVAGNTGTASPTVAIYAGDTGTLAETFGTGNSANYAAAYTCTGGNVTVTNTGALTVPSTPTNSTCTVTNTRNSATLAVNKVWAANSKAGDVVTVSTTGLTNNATAPASTATAAGNTGTASAAVTIFAGDTGTLGESFGTGTAANYAVAYTCTGGNVSVTNTGALTVPSTPTNSTCTVTNTRNSATLKVAKIWAANSKAGDTTAVTTTGLTNNATSGNSVATAAGNTTTGATAVTIYAGDAGNLTEAFSVGTMSNYAQTYSCSAGNMTVSATGALTVPSIPTNSTCAITNSRIAQQLKLAKQWANVPASDTVTKGSATTTGGTNNATFSATAPTNTTGTAVTVYAGDSVTLPTETITTGTGSATYTTTVACTGDTTLASSSAPQTITISNANTSGTTCTYTNTAATVLAPNITLTKYVRNTGNSGEKFNTAKGTGYPGNQLQYCIAYKNTGGAASNFKLTDLFPANTTYVASSLIYVSPAPDFTTLSASPTSTAFPSGATYTTGKYNADGTANTTATADTGVQFSTPSIPAGTTAAPATGAICFTDQIQ